MSDTSVFQIAPVTFDLPNATVPACDATCDTFMASIGAMSSWARCRVDEQLATEFDAFGDMYARRMRSEVSWYAAPHPTSRRHRRDSATLFEQMSRTWQECSDANSRWARDKIFLVPLETVPLIYAYHAKLVSVSDNLTVGNSSDKKTSERFWAGTVGLAPQIEFDRKKQTLSLRGYTDTKDPLTRLLLLQLQALSEMKPGAQPEGCEWIKQMTVTFPEVAQVSRCISSALDCLKKRSGLSYRPEEASYFW